MSTDVPAAASPSAGGSGTVGGSGASYDPEAGARAWRLAVAAIDLALDDATRLGGLVLHGRHGPVRVALLARIEARTMLRRLPADVDGDALDDGIDVTRTLAEGHTVPRRGILSRAERDGTALLVGGAERLPVAVGVRLARWLDARQEYGPRPDAARPAPLIVLDESVDGTDEVGARSPGDVADPGFVASALGERLALHVPVPVLALGDLARLSDDPFGAPTVEPDGAVDAPLPTLPDGLRANLVRLADRLGVDSLRSTVQACRVARGVAARAGRDEVTLEDAAVAAQLVLSPRALRLAEQAPAEDAAEAEERPADADPSAQESEPPPEPPTEPNSDTGDDAGPEEDVDAPPDAAGAPPDTVPADASDAERLPPDAAERLPDRLVEAANAALPRDLLAALAGGLARRRGPAARAGTASTAARRGRPAGLERPRAGSRPRRLDVVATLKVAAPWQRLRPAPPHGGLALRVDDFRIRRYVAPQRTTTLFVVDASGSAAAQRIGEAKGALEGVLAECYIRRDRVALISFRGTAATLELPPTRSLARAKRALEDLPAGGGTPLAAAFDLAADVIGELARAGENTVAIFMTDGRANVSRDGTGGRAAATLEALEAARRLAALEASLLFVDTASRPRADARDLAAALRARYLPLPVAGGAGLAAVVADGRG